MALGDYLSKIGSMFRPKHRQDNPDNLYLPYDDFAVPKVVQFAGIYGSAWRTFLRDRWDEALKKSREDALVMRRDAFLMGIYDEGRRSVIKQKWSLKVPNDKDANQKLVKDHLTKCVEMIPHFKRMKWALLDAKWYGKYASQVVWKWDEVDGVRSLLVRQHQPVNGDKVGHMWDGTPTLSVNAAEANRFRNADLIYDTQGMALVLRGTWRERFIIHTHEVDDADYFAAEQAEGIHGIGIRHRLFWTDYLKREFQAWYTDYLERVGLGVNLWYYDASNPAALAAVQKASKDQSKRMDIHVPLWPDKGGAMRGGLERIETPIAGAEVLLGIIEHFEKIEERLIIGQAASSRSETSGLGTHDTDLQEDTKRDITVLEAENLAETLTGSAEEPGVISVMKRWTFPWADFPVTFEYKIGQPDPEKVLEACKVFVEMGGELVEDEVRGLIPDMSKPTEDDIILGGKEALAAQQEADAAGAFGSANGKPPGENGESKNGQSKEKENGHAKGFEPENRIKQYQDEDAQSNGTGVIAPSQNGAPQEVKIVLEQTVSQPTSLSLDDAIHFLEEIVPVEYVTDAEGHEHKPAGTPEGGQFTGKRAHEMSKDEFYKTVWAHGTSKEAAAKIEKEGLKRGEFAPPHMMNRAINYGWSKLGLNAVEAQEMNRGLVPIPEERHGVVYFARKPEVGEKADAGFMGLKLIGKLPFAQAREDPHKAFVKMALADGWKVPEEVLKEYPDLAPGEKPAQYMLDASGHEHKPAGSPDGGQFTGKGESSGESKPVAEMTDSEIADELGKVANRQPRNKAERERRKALYDEGSKRMAAEEKPAKTDEDVANIALEVARTLPATIGGGKWREGMPGWESHRVILADVYDAAKDKLGGMSLDEFKAAIFRAHKAGQVELSRMDLPQFASDTEAGDRWERAERSNVGDVGFLGSEKNQINANMRPR